MNIAESAEPHASAADLPAATTALPAGIQTAAVLVSTLGLAAGSWVIAVWRMNGMDMGVATRLGPFAYFVAVWVPMMAAMMLPGAAPAVLRRAQATGRLWAVPAFVAYYMTVWALLGLPIYGFYRPHGTTAAGVVVIAAGAYELTPVKRHFRRRCHEMTASGWRFGFCCVGSSLGLMLMLVALGIMSVAWMTVIAILVIAQKFLPARAGIDVPVALAILAFGTWILIAPASVPWLMPGM